MIIKVIFNHGRYRYISRATPTFLQCNSLIMHRVPTPLHSRFYGNRLSKAIAVSHEEVMERVKNKETIADIYHGVSDPRIIYSSYINDHTVKVSFGHKKRLGVKIKQREKEKRYDASVPLIIEKLMLLPKRESNLLTTESYKVDNTPTYFPYSHTQDIEIQPHISESRKEVENLKSMSSENIVKEEIELRMQAYDLGILQEPEKCETRVNYKAEEIKKLEELIEDEDTLELKSKKVTADPNIPVSKVPCGGCGAHLHCQEPAFPGFIPKEWFVGLNAGELRGVLCQRCHYLKYQNTALNVRVTPELYPKLLEPIKDQMALAIVVIDLLDMPCSIWPNLMDIIGINRPVVVVGNKVDLLPADGKNHLERVNNALVAAVNKTDLGQANIRHVALVSAHTGFGIENLITKIQNFWGTKGDIYLLGCTNSGKSTLFNALLSSDLCKSHASNLIPHATVSPWPGTTLNMLKFPVLRPSGYRLYLRTKRLIAERKKLANDKPMYTRTPALATLSGHIGRTFVKPKEPMSEGSDPFSLKMRATPEDRKEIVGINPKSKYYELSKWCYDTPGTVQPDQIINLLSHQELMKVLPRRIIFPQTFTLKMGETLFIGGLARLDLLYSPQAVRFTVFRSEKLPLTAVKTVDAAAFYCTYVGSEFLGVPLGNEERLQSWPALKPKNFRMYSTGKGISCADVVLSSAGWVAVTGLSEGEVVEVRGWTAGGRGAHLRQPSVLPLAVNLKGHRKSHSIIHEKHKMYVPR